MPRDNVADPKAEKVNSFHINLQHILFPASTIDTLDTGWFISGTSDSLPLARSLIGRLWQHNQARVFGTTKLSGELVVAAPHLTQ
jgi:hypothetical protein